MLRSLALFTLLAGLPAGLWAADPVVTATQAPGLIGVRIDGQPFATFNLGAGLVKPYVEPLRAPGGHVVTALAPFDHKHHKGIWVGVEHVNGVNFWGGKYQQQDAVEPSRASERIENVSSRVESQADGSVVVTLVNDWQGPEGKTVLEETTRVTITGDRLMCYDISLKATNGPVHFQDTKEGFLAIRVAPTMIAKAGGKIVNAEGLVGEEECWGKTSPWVDYSGLVDGKPVGVALFDAPSNVRKSRYHVRGYGLFAISPFGEKVYSKGTSAEIPTALEANQAFRIQYGVYVHAGDAEKGNVAAAYEKFVKLTAAK